MTRDLTTSLFLNQYTQLWQLHTCHDKIDLEQHNETGSGSEHLW